jgi:hypothetical protein
MPFHWLSFHQWVIMMNPGFITGNFLGCFVFNGEHFQHTFYTYFPVAKVSDAGHNHRFSNPCCGAQFTCCDVAVTWNQCIKVFSSSSSLPWLVGRCRTCHSVLFTTLKTTDPVSNWANICGILTIHASQMSVNLYGTGAFLSKKLIHHSLPSTYIHNIHHTALLLCWTHVADWSTDDPRGAGQCRYLVGKTRSWTMSLSGGKGKEIYPAPHLKIGDITFIPTFILVYMKLDLQVMSPLVV